ncbi:hypothetical protein [uncultured Sphaerotilus sp.]|uniref:hypothetical protein n=1 Tax=uncultured Sphaerotilus sp. TaxID=474984 RepID=UPI0030CA5230
MEAITRHSISVATDQAVRLWALSSAEYPKHHEPLINSLVANTLDITSIFALNCRRALEILPPKEKFPLDTPRWIWTPSTTEARVTDLWDATNRIIHAQRLLIGLEKTPDHLSVIDGESVFMPYIQAETDRRELAFIDPFALAHAFLYGALPRLLKTAENNRPAKN